MTGEVVRERVERREASLFAVLSFVGSLLVLITYWFFWIRPAYYPSGDEFALLASSAKMFHPSIAGWFLEGFRNYFIAYPGLSGSSTDFVRPVANASYYVNSLIFGTHWAYYLLLNYAVQAGLVSVATLMARRIFALPKRACALVALMVFLSPAFGWQAVYYPSFAFDLLAALLVLLGFYALWKGWFVAAWACVALAVFTKETALFAPVAVAILLWGPGGRSLGTLKRAAYTVVWLAPILAWVLVRHLAFHGEAGIYVLQGLTLRGQFLNLVHGLLAWPFGTRSTQQSAVYRLLFFPLNAMFWLSGVYVLYRSVSKTSSGFLRFVSPVAMVGDHDKEAFRVLLLVTGCASLMPLLLNLPQRFGGSFYPLLALLLVVIVQRAKGLFRKGAAAAIAASLIMAVYQKAIDPTTLGQTSAEWVLARSYIETIHRASARNLLIVNDASGGFTSPGLVARFASFPGTLVHSNNLYPRSVAQCSGQLRTASLKQDDRLTITSFVTPSCGFYAFDSVPWEAVAAAKSGLLLRAGDGWSIRVHQPAYVPELPSGVPVMYGTLTVEVSGSSADRQVIAPNLTKMIYEPLD